MKTPGFGPGLSEQIACVMSTLKHFEDEYNLAMHRKYKPLKHTEWRKPDTKWSHIVWLHLHEMSRIGKSIGTELRLVAARVWGEGRIGQWG